MDDNELNAIRSHNHVHTASESVSESESDFVCVYFFI